MLVMLQQNIFPLGLVSVLWVLELDGSEVRDGAAAPVRSHYYMT